jgi:hypothetical protein
MPRATGSERDAAIWPRPTSGGSKRARGIGGRFRREASKAAKPLPPPPPPPPPPAILNPLHAACRNLLRAAFLNPLHAALGSLIWRPSPRRTRGGAHRTSRTVSTPYEHLTTHGPANGQNTVRHRTTPYDKVRQSTTPYDKVRQSTTKYDNVRHRKTPYQTPYATPYEHRTNTVRDVRSAPL